MRLVTPVSVCEGYDPASPPPAVPKAHDAKALWDTGATHTCISNRLAAKMGLTPCSATSMNHANGQSFNVPVYMINLRLPNDVIIAGILAAEFPPSADEIIDILIGMDVITRGDFAITQPSGKTKMSFCTPPTRDIDFVREIDQGKAKGVGRNDPCKCGSGKKYKKCCLGRSGSPPSTPPPAPATPATPAANPGPAVS